MEGGWDPRRDGNHPPQNNWPVQPFYGYPYPNYFPLGPQYGLPQAFPYGIPYGPPGAYASPYGVPYNQPPPALPRPPEANVQHEQLPSQMNSFAITPARQSDSAGREPLSPPIDPTEEDLKSHEGSGAPSPIGSTTKTDRDDEIQSNSSFVINECNFPDVQVHVSEVSPVASPQKSITGSPHVSEQGKFPVEMQSTGDGDNEEPPVREIVRPDTTGERVDSFDVLKYLKCGNYPSHLSKNQKSNFRRQVRPYFVSEGKLLYKRKTGERLEVVMERKQQLRLIQLAHEGGSSSFEASALSGHRGRDGVISTLSKKYYWVGMNADVREFVRTCEKCQLARKDTLKVVPELRPVPVPKEVMKQVGIDICQLPPSGDLRYIVLAIDYVSKWSEAEALPDKSAASVAKFIYSCICKHGCHRVQINDQGREFVNAVSDELFRLTGTQQRITSAYHPQANGLVERQNRTVKSFLLKVLQDRVEDWPACLEGVLFAHRTMVHASTGYTPFYLLYGREAVLPLDVERGVLDGGQEEDVDDELGSASCEDKGMEDEEETAPFSAPNFKERLESILRLKSIVENEVQTNIKKAQEKQKRYYDRRHNVGKNLWKVGDVVLLTNPRNLFRKGGKMELSTRGPYEIVAVTDNFLCTLKNIKTDVVLKAKHNMQNLSAYAKRKPELDLGDTHDDVRSKKQKSEEQSPECKEDESILVMPSENKEESGRFFFPVDAQWQEEKCTSMGMQLKCRREKMEAVPLLRPKTWSKIRGDGNCFFRCIAHYISGDTNDHSAVRRMVTEYMVQHPDEYSQTDTNKMKKSGTWATEEEIIATAHLLQTNLYVWSVFGNKWTWALFSRLPGRVAVYTGKEPSIYIKNTNRDHYDVVDSVMTPDEEASRPSLR